MSLGNRVSAPTKDFLFSSGLETSLKCFLWNYFVGALSVCFGSLYCRKTQTHPTFNICTEGRSWLPKIWRYLAPSILSSGKLQTGLHMWRLKQWGPSTHCNVLLQNCGHCSLQDLHEVLLYSCWLILHGRLRHTNSHLGFLSFSNNCSNSCCPFT